MTLSGSVPLPITPSTSIISPMSQVEVGPIVATDLQPELGTDGPKVPWPQRARSILLWLMVIGAALRILRYLANRSLWLDEAYLADSVLTFSFKQLLTRPLLYWQAAPPGFLMLQKSAVTLLGTGEYALRLVPLLAGLTSLPLFYGIIRRCLGPTACVIAMLLFIVLDPLVYYSAESKQYGLDVMFSLAIVWSAMRLRDEPLSGGRVIAMAGIGILGIGCSHPSVFVLAAAGLALIWEFRRSELRNRLIVIIILWVGLFAAEYFLFLRPLTHHSGLAAYWAGDYMPYQCLAAIKWLGIELYGLYHGYATMWLPMVDAAILATLLGIIRFWRRDRAMLAMLMLPLIFTLAAAAVHAYPFGSRLVLFLVPALVVLIGAGGAMIWESFVPGRRIIPSLILASIILPTAARAVYYVLIPAKREEIRPMLEYVREHKKSGDVLYLFHISEIPFRYYQDRFGLEENRGGLADMTWIFGQSGDSDVSVYRADLARLRGKGRVWVLITHPRAVGGIDEEQLFPAILDQWGRQIDRVNAFNACAILYEMKSATAAGK